MKDYKVRNKRDGSHSQVDTELQRFSPSEIMDTEVTHTI